MSSTVYYNETLPVTFWSAGWPSAESPAAAEGFLCTFALAYATVTLLPSIWQSSMVFLAFLHTSSLSKSTKPNLTQRKKQVVLQPRWKLSHGLEMRRILYYSPAGNFCLFINNYSCADRPFKNILQSLCCCFIIQTCYYQRLCQL